ncbi:2-hydroxyacid dehydrogenase [Microvirga sp. GCM10011540]|uniref:2-hydroxyacid dehydrogenase n=1 Tax=Microvirga sp. GCM10011540 TaxID=3317338 RepID=UPI003622E511
MKVAFFEKAIREQIEDELSFRHIETKWPDEPFAGRDGVAGPSISEYSGDLDTVKALVADADIAITHLGPFPRDVIEAAPNLRFIGVSRGGPVNIDMEAARERGIAVANVPGRNASAVAEFTIGAILSQTRLITPGHVALARGEWRGDLYRADRTGEELSQMTVGILGYSHVGQRVIRLLKPFGCRLLVCDPYVKLTVQDQIDGVEQVDLDTLLARSDVVSLHVRVTKETIGMISEARIARMKDGAYLINTARGSLIDQKAMVAALRSGKLRGAAVDTFDLEPPPEGDEILSLPNITLTPHIAGASRYVCTFAANTLADDLARFLTGQPLVNPCN